VSRFKGGDRGHSVRYRLHDIYLLQFENDEIGKVCDVMGRAGDPLHAAGSNREEAEIVALL